VDTPNANNSASETIEPALTAAQWSEWRAKKSRDRAHVLQDIRDAADSAFGSPPATRPTDIGLAATALLNDCLPDEDPRKISWETIDMLQSFIQRLHREKTGSADDRATLQRLTAALESWLPPDV